MDMAYYVLMMQADARREAAEYRRAHPSSPRRMRRRAGGRSVRPHPRPAGSSSRPAAA